jgi:DNA-binding CsgD family transcriptional regulator
MKSESIPLLSPREKRLLRRFAAGKTDAAIAMELGDKESRIAAQRKRLIEKLQIRSDDQLSAAADRFAPWSRRKVGISPTD